MVTVKSGLRSSPWSAGGLASASRMLSIDTGRFNVGASSDADWAFATDDGARVCPGAGLAISNAASVRQSSRIEVLTFENSFWLHAYTSAGCMTCAST